MNRDVYALAEAGKKLRESGVTDGFGTVHRAPHPDSMHNDDRGARCHMEEVQQKSMDRRKRFWNRLRVELSKLVDAGKSRHDLEKFERRHQAGFRNHEAQLLSPPKDPPCKNWRKKLARKMHPGTLKELDKLWALNVHEWAKQYLYLASPSAKCECLKCAGPGIARAATPADPWGLSEPMAPPNWGA